MDRSVRRNLRPKPFPNAFVILLCAFLLCDARYFLVKAASRFTCQTWNKTTVAASGSNDGWTIGAKRLLFYRVRFSDTTETEPISVEAANEILANINTTFQRMSFGKFSIDWTITPLIELDHETAYYSNSDFNTLLFDVRNAAASIGWGYEDFDFDLIRCPQIPGFPQGQANIRQKGAVVHADLANVYLHELGHNLGLFHANSWDNTRPDLKPRNNPPFPSDVANYSEPFVFDAASLLGDGDLRTPGRSVEYGDFFDLMATGTGDYNASSKARLGWLKREQVQTTAENGFYRLYAYDQGSTQSDRLYALRIDRLVEGRGGGFTFRFWASFRNSSVVNGISAPGLEIHWIDPGESYTSQLLDMVPGSAAAFLDAPLPLGKTFIDGESGLCITPRRSGLTGSAAWMDVQIQMSPPANNHAPLLSLSASSMAVAPGEEIQLIAQSSDPDGNDLSLFWTLGDGTFATGDRQTKFWKTPGQYVVSCQASDGVGGLVTRQLLVVVGNPTTLLIQGRLISEDGSPVAGVLVNNGRIDSENGIMLPGFVSAKTDSDGAFILSNLNPGDYWVSTSVYGYNVQRTDAFEPVHLELTNVAGIEFVATPLPRVAVEFERSSIREGETTQIVFTRTGSTKESLPLEFLLNGSAGMGQDYKSYSSQSVVIPSGSASVSIPFEALPDFEEESSEQAIITAVPAENTFRLSGGRGVPEEVNYHYPGWELRQRNAGGIWFQTLPSFRRESEATAVLTILDTTAPGLQRVSVLADTSIATERPLASITLHLQRVGSTQLPLVVHYTLHGSAINGLDYIELPLSVTIPSGSDSVEVIISPLSDGTLEGAETIEFALDPSPNYILQDPSSASLVLQEDPFNSAPNTVTFGKRFDATIVIRMAGENGKTYVLETSEDMIHWNSVSTNLIDFSPVGIPIPPMSDGQRFYRGRRVLP